MILGLIICAGAFLGLWLLEKLLAPKDTHPPLPPGPWRKPIIGNLTDFPPKGTPEWLFWAKHQEKYGPISSLEVMGQTIIMINDTQLGIEIMHKKSALSQMIPDAPFAHMAGWGMSLATERNKQAWKTIRANMKQEIGTRRAVSAFHPKMEIGIRRFLLRTLDSPDDLRFNIRKEANAFMMDVAYGYTIAPYGKDELYDLTQRSVRQFSHIFSPGEWSVNFFPILRYVPSWFPGASFQVKAAEYKRTIEKMTMVPYLWIKDQVARDCCRPSILLRLLQKGHYESGSQEEQVLVWTNAEFVMGGSDTTVSAVSSFFVAMALYPEVQRKAREELDRVVGPTTLATFEHRSQLPFIDALVKEAFRWHPASPLGAPHITQEDQIWDGYLLPRGALLLPNIWAFTHDPSVYHDPMVFKPERFLEGNGSPPETDPMKFVFGFGRRICPGRFITDEKLFLLACHTLSCFLISPKDPAAPEPDWLPGVISQPSPFGLNVVPRSPAHEALIRSIETDHPWKNADATDISRFMARNEMI
ncbi:O-methylsterigmatocystin oxidoreductase [Aspergillus pseudonomiae]|uniref:O-methylsterigmatocystin oxidoreductase n=1 Tax=Aspergillus pseudonomiae TaxID=1506151 RepID=A0A5N6HPJ7_9EURO|nr:O-methylsterigmatocystin oxidoreductase [Aspergillus pseudonomiae]KAB8256198.1 O-methylsterigmatocystin oxidoreductase [Aspergillus pseudonomiae]KAE8400781.1 O-methylsterigmatocystin oxidoreductase [Aspergillus pseudonomiae]